jgi:hypothetical protein
LGGGCGSRESRFIVAGQPIHGESVEPVTSVTGAELDNVVAFVQSLKK